MKKLIGGKMKQRYKVILDTDMSNEIDDQFALTYLIKSLDVFDLKAITIAPFQKSKYAPELSVKDGVDLSFNTTLKILQLLNFKDKAIVYKGSIDYMKNGYDAENEAVKAIKEIALTNDKIYILAIGAITNVALAIKKYPEIIKKIEVIWLGGNSFLYNENDEFNFIQDIEAVKTVFSSGIKLTVIPCRNVASNLVTTIYEIENFIRDKKEIGKFLCDAFENCKKREPGISKTLWDLSAVAYLINKSWFKEESIKCPGILDDGKYIMNYYNHKVVFIKDLRRDHIFGDFFKKMEK